MMLVTQIESAGWRSSHSTTTASGLVRINADNTFVSRTITNRTSRRSRGAWQLGRSVFSPAPRERRANPGEGARRVAALPCRTHRQLTGSSTGQARIGTARSLRTTSESRTTSLEAGREQRWRCYCELRRASSAGQFKRSEISRPRSSPGGCTSTRVLPSGWIS
jgi:hypothetical protein